MNGWIKLLLAWLGVALIVGPLIGIAIKKLGDEDDFYMQQYRR